MEASSCLPSSSKVSFSDEVVEIPFHTPPLSADAASGSDFDYVESASEGEDWSSESSDQNDAEMWEQILDGAYCSAVPPKMDPAERDSLLLFDKDLVEDLEGVYLKFCVYSCAVS